MGTLVTRSAGATARAAAVVIRELTASRRRPIVLALTGPLGSGKTAFVQGLARSLGIRERVQSPTFVLVKRYQLPARSRHRYGFRHFVHIDAYRLDSVAQARHLGLGAVFRDPNTVVVVEWADRIRKLIPRSTIWIHLKHGRGTRERTIKFVKHAKRVK